MVYLVELYYNVVSDGGVHAIDVSVAPRLAQEFEAARDLTNLTDLTNVCDEFKKEMKI